MRTRDQFHERNRTTKQNVRKFPAMTPPLVNHLHYDGMPDYGNDILLVQVADTPHLDNHKKRYHHALYALKLSLPDQENLLPWNNIQ